MTNKSSITRLKDVPELKNAVDLLLCGDQLSLQQKEFLLSAAVLLIRDFEKDQSHRQSLEFAYWIILSYALSTKDFDPLYDFAVSFGLYPICDAITSVSGTGSLLKGFASEAIRRSFSRDGHVETIEQSNRAIAFNREHETDVAYLAPTSFGKSELVLNRVVASGAKNKTCIVVPTKSLLSQMARAVKRGALEKKLITHDEMYGGEGKFIAILTQERALRLLSSNENLSFDELYIDEAHHLYDSTGRAMLLTRLVKLSKRRNRKVSLFYLSPIITEVGHLSALSGSEVAEIRVRFNMKEPQYRIFLRDGSMHAFNRFFGEYLDLCLYVDMWRCITCESGCKNLIYVNSPKKIQQAARELASKLPLIPLDDELNKVISMLSAHVHVDYDEIECIKHGVLYLHGQMPDGIKDYLEYKYNTLSSLRYVVANTVVLEGVNLPIDSIFILSSTHLNKRNLVNLVGRASRLNHVFGKLPNLSGLMPKVTFIDNDEYDRKGGNMKNTLERLRSMDFQDNVENPVIKLNEGIPLNDKESEAVELEKFIDRDHEEELDSFKSEFYSDLLKDQQNNLERSIYTVTIGKSLNSPIDHVAKSFFISAIYGSLTHLLITNDLLECFALFLCEQYGTNRFGSLSMNMLLRSGDGKKIEGMVQSLDNLDDPKTPHNAYSVYEMASACAMPGRRLATRFEAFRRLGIYMSDADFTMATASFMCAAQAFEVGDIRDVSTGVSLVNAIHANAPRIDKGWANSQLLRMMETGLLEVQKEVLKVVEWGAIDLKIADEDYIIRLIEAIEKAADRHSDFLGYQAAIALFTLCSERPELTERCSKAADEHLNERYREVFFTEVSDKDETALESIERFISIIEENNQRQGENGVWVQSSVAEYDNTANLIASLADPPLEIIARAAQAALGTLLNKNSFLSDKTNAYIMMMRLLALPAVQGIEDLDITAEDILKININTVSSPMIYENEALINLSIDHEVFLYAVGLSDGSRLEDLLIETYAAREFDQAHAAKALTSMLNAIDLSMLEPKIASFLHAYAGSLFKSPSFQVRIVVIELLFVMLGIPMLASNISRQLVNSYDAKSPNEKCRIIRHHGAIHDANADVWVELKRKALNDSCSISRLLAEEVF